MILVNYVLKEHIAPFFAALFVTTFLFVINFLVEVLDKILSKGIPAQIVLEIFALNVVWMVGLAAPMSVLAATLMTFGRLSADREITAMQAAGISPLSMMRPVIIFSVLLMVLLVLFNNWLLPEANYRSAMLMQSISRKKPSALIDEGKLINQFPGVQLWVSRIENDELYGIKIFEIGGSYPRVITADSASMEYVDMGATLMLYLKNGENHFIDPKDPERYFRIRFANQDFAMQNINDNFERTDQKSRGDREMPIEDMWKVVQEAKADMQKLIEEYKPSVWTNANNLTVLLKKDTILPEDLRSTEPEPDSLRHVKAIEIVKAAEAEALTQVNRMEIRRDGLLRRIASYMVEIHKKISTAVACVVFALIGAPLGIIARRGGIGPGTVYSLGFFAVYWVCLIGGENLADKLIVSPAVAMWACNVFIGTIGLFLTWRVAKR